MVRLPRVWAHADPAAPSGADGQEPSGVLPGMQNRDHRQYLV